MNDAYLVIDKVVRVFAIWAAAIGAIACALVAVLVVKAWKATCRG